MTSFVKFLFIALLPFTVRADEWISLFDGKSLAGWTAPDGAAPGPGWNVADGTLHLDGRGGNILSAKEYSSFELVWSWKISPKGNNGIKYWVTTIGRDWLGPEYQIIDDNGHPDALIGKKRSTACLYDIQSAAADKPLKPVGEWNESRVITRNGVIEHYLNGSLVCRVDTTAAEWKSLLDASKFRGKVGFASGKGRIMITDHADKVWYKDIKIREFAEQKK